MQTEYGMMQSLSERKDIVDAMSFLFCVYDEPSIDLCLHNKNLYLANVYHRAFKRDSIRSKQIEQESACSIIG